jgi:NAD(P)H-hydrate repair Nnr-like enzyme with NAD(P)H-hydrate dehydratase domain
MERMTELPSHDDTWKVSYGPENDSTTIIYRLYTENAADLPELVARYLPSATLYGGLGLWQGKEEQSCVIEFVGHRSDLQQIVFLADAIKFTNKQQSVLLTHHRIDTLTV